MSTNENVPAIYKKYIGNLQNRSNHSLTMSSRPPRELYRVCHNLSYTDKHLNIHTFILIFMDQQL